jgi:hypothetical protein
MDMPTAITGEAGLKPKKTTAKKRPSFNTISLYGPHPPTLTSPPIPPLQCKYGGVGLLILFFCLSSHCYTYIQKYLYLDASPHVQKYYSVRYTGRTDRILNSKFFFKLECALFEGSVSITKVALTVNYDLFVRVNILQKVSIAVSKILGSPT